MKIETLRLQNFRCFGPQVVELQMEDKLTTLVGGNGSGKTAVLQALSRLFGISATQRAIRRRDFYISTNKNALQTGDKLFIEAILIFPELEQQNENSYNAIPEFFNQMSVSAEGQPLKARIRLQATWIEDGTNDGIIEEELRWIRSLDDNFIWDECSKVQAAERASIQFIYLPANRDASTQVTSLFKGRLWQAAKWSSEFKNRSAEQAQEIQRNFGSERPAQFLLDRITQLWKQVHEADTDTTPCLRLIENNFEDLIRKAEFTFMPDESAHEHRLFDLSDGQRSLFHIALTAATLEAERDAILSDDANNIFEQEKLHRTSLTILAVEEPENSLSPFFLSRIVSMLKRIGSFYSAQVLLSSHSPAIMGRIDPNDVRYLRKNPIDRCSSIRKLTLPEAPSEANAYVRLAVRAHPELYFARFVILGEGDSEKFIIKQLAEIQKIPLDPSFVPIIPLGGRYVEHFWRLLDDLDIPHATLLDLDLGRTHGGVKIIKNCIETLKNIHNISKESQNYKLKNINLDTLNQLRDQDLLNLKGKSLFNIFQEMGIFFSFPLDIDFSMLHAFPDVYTCCTGGRGPNIDTSRININKSQTLKEGGNPNLYSQEYDETFLWYPYLFLRRSKPETHFLAFSCINNENINQSAPPELLSLIKYVKDKLQLVEDT